MMNILVINKDLAIAGYIAKLVRDNPFYNAYEVNEVPSFQDSRLLYPSKLHTVLILAEGGDEALEMCLEVRKTEKLSSAEILLVIRPGKCSSNSTNEASKIASITLHDEAYDAIYKRLLEIQAKIFYMVESEGFSRTRNLSQDELLLLWALQNGYSDDKGLRELGFGKTKIHALLDGISTAMGWATKKRIDTLLKSIRCFGMLEKQPDGKISTPRTK